MTTPHPEAPAEGADPAEPDTAHPDDAPSEDTSEEAPAGAAVADR